MYVCSTNLQGPQSNPDFPVAVYEALLFCLMCPVQILDRRFILQFQFLVGILMKENMSQNVSAKCKNQATYM
jgi:hypothetical protein